MKSGQSGPLNRRCHYGKSLHQVRYLSCDLICHRNCTDRSGKFHEIVIVVNRSMSFFTQKAREMPLTNPLVGHDPVVPGSMEFGRQKAATETRVLQRLQLERNHVWSGLRMSSLYGGFHKMGLSKKCLIIRENRAKMNDFAVPLFQQTPISMGACWAKCQRSWQPTHPAAKACLWRLRRAAVQTRQRHQILRTYGRSNVSQTVLHPGPLPGVSIQMNLLKKNELSIVHTVQMKPCWHS